MIALSSDCLLFRMAGGESIPFSAEMISVELMGGTAKYLDSEFVRHAAKAVFHYFKHELERQSVSIREFAGALERVLKGFVLTAKTPDLSQAGDSVARSDLALLALQSGEGCELFFFPRLRDEVRTQLRQSPRILHFRGLRVCVKQLAGAQRWTPRCQSLHDQIVEFLRHCLSTEPKQVDCALLVH
jgi:hypothetical protein